MDAKDDDGLKKGEFVTNQKAEMRKAQEEKWKGTVYEEPPMPPIKKGANRITLQLIRKRSEHNEGAAPARGPLFRTRRASTHGGGASGRGEVARRPSKGIPPTVRAAASPRPLDARSR